MPRVLVLGGSGRLGRALAAELLRRGTAFDAPGRAALDLSIPGAAARWIAAHAPPMVLNAAAFTDVGAAERPENDGLVHRLNRDLPEELAGACARAAIPLLHVSTDYVFDGASTRPYLEDDPVDPLQVYGRSKLEGERGALGACPGTLVVRVSTLYGHAAPGREAYVDAILRQARAGDVEVVETPVSSPTYATDVAPACLELLDRGARGVVHVVNDGAASRLDLARAAVELAGLTAAVRTKPEPASALTRPKYSVLGTAKLVGLVGRTLPHWRDALARYLAP